MNNNIDLVNKLVDHGANPYATSYGGENILFSVEDPRIIEQFSFLINRYNCQGKVKFNYTNSIDSLFLK